MIDKIDAIVLTNQQLKHFPMLNHREKKYIVYHVFKTGAITLFLRIY